MKMMLRRLAIVVCVTLALLSAAYAFAVLRTHSGTGFWKVWLVLAVVFALLAIGIACHWWAALPRIIRGAIIAVVAIGIVAFCTIEGCIIGDYLEENPDTICIVSGGQGHNEPFAEAQGMADYLQKHGIAENRIIQESKSESTMENIVNSKKLMRQENASVGIVTNDFHMFRALQIAHANGLKQAQGIAASSPKDMLVNNMVREFFAEIKFLFS